MNHLTLRQRVIIQYAIENDKHTTLLSLAKQCGVNTSTIYREIKNRSTHSVSKMKKFQGSKAPICPKLSCFPYVCNACTKRTSCSKSIVLYDAYTAHEQARKTLKESRSKASLNKEEMAALNAIVSPAIMNNQSLYHIVETNPDIEVSQSTIRRYVDKGYLDARNVDLPRTVRFYNKKYISKKRKRINVQILKNRTFKDYEDYTHSQPRVTLQLDTMIGKLTDKKCLLTLYEPLSKFQWGILVYKTASSVNQAISKMVNLLYQHNLLFFDCILLDNGAEFQQVPLLEINEEGELLFRVFYCDPYASFQKGGCERNHEFVRYVIKKGESFDFFHQDEIDQLFSHINSLKRKSLNGKSPIQRFVELFHFAPSEFFNIFEIPASKLKLKK